jgi:hypothetical protein
LKELKGNPDEKLRNKMMGAKILLRTAIMRQQPVYQADSTAELRLMD